MQAGQVAAARPARTYAGSCGTPANRHGCLAGFAAALVPPRHEDLAAAEEPATMHLMKLPEVALRQQMQMGPTTTGSIRWHADEVTFGSAGYPPPRWNQKKKTWWAAAMSRHG